MRAALTVFTCASLAVLAQAPYYTSIRPADLAHDLPVNRGSAALWQSLKKLHTRASLIMITAHPDDEDGGMLTYESRGRGTRVSLLTLNRGEGGANVMSSDYFDALGLVRTQELLAAGRYYGVDQYWTRVVDYGFSKTKAESIAKWTHDRVLYDVVRVVRMVRPLVVTAVFVGGPSDGHGNHETAGAMAQEVVQAAGDPKVFPDQLRSGLRPWSALKCYARLPFRRTGPQLTANIEIPAGDYDPVLGASYAQIAREGLGLQKSQNGGPSLAPPGPLTSRYHRFAPVPSASHEETFFDGIDTSLLGLAPAGDPGFVLAGLRKINAAVEEAVAAFSAAHPERCAPALAIGARETASLTAQIEKLHLSDDATYNLRHELDIKLAQFNHALAQSLGVAIAASVEPDAFRIAVPGQSFPVNVRVANQGPTPVTLDRVSVRWAPPQSVAEFARSLDLKFTVKVPEDAPLTRPYFSRPDIEQPYYDIENERFLYQPMTPYPLAAWAEFSYDGVPIRLGQTVQTVKRVNGLGTVYEPLVLGPAIGVRISPRAGVIPLALKSFALSATIHSNVKGPASGTVRLELPQGWKSDPPSSPFSTQQDGEDRTVTFTVTPSGLSARPYAITAVALHGGREYREGYAVTGYPGLRPGFLYTPSTYKTTGVDVKIAPGLRVAYIMGSGDEVPASLENLGIKANFLAALDIATGDLSRFDVIILGVRGFAARPELATYNNRLLEFANNGGIVIVQYNTPEYDHNYGPYPYQMGRNPEEVTDEASKVQILEPANPIFNWPNKISAHDFEGWVEERGSKWMASWDPRYQALLETHDQGQQPQKGGLLFARYGRGIYIYNAYAFYRQLPEGVPGAYRIFANMLSLAKSPAR